MPKKVRRHAVKPLRREAEDYLEYSGKVVTEYEVVGCSCRSRFCETCAVGRGYALRRRILDAGAIRKFEKLQMWTLTIDPTLFENPKAAYLYCRKERVISRLIRGLRSRGYLLSRHYFAAVEWQANGMVHYHLLVDAKYIPFEVVAELWNRNRPVAAGPVVGSRPAFGAVRFSISRFGTAAHAINYATKYVIKTPSHGWPEWVLNARENVPRYMVSQGFWEDGGGKPKGVPRGVEVLDCMPTAEEMQRDGMAREDLAGEAFSVERLTVAERVAGCRMKAVIMQVERVVDQGGTVVRTMKTYVGECAYDFRTIANAAGFTILPFRFTVSRDIVGRLLVKETEDEKNRSSSRYRDCARGGTNKGRDES